MSASGLTDLLSNLLSGFGITDCIDILIVAFVVFKLMGFIRETRAEQLVKGLLVLVAATYIAELCNLYTLYWLLKSTLTIGAIALVVVFQPELRRGLEYLGRTRFVWNNGNSVDKAEAKRVTTELTAAVQHFSANKVGALIVIEQNTSLNDIAETGTPVNADISRELLGTIFYEGTPLHDGAVILRGSKVLTAGCLLPLTQSRTLDKELGTRHRAALGISENSDATVIVVSEETGIISVAKEGVLTRFLDKKAVEKQILGCYLSRAGEVPVKKGLARFFATRKKEGNRREQ